LKILFSIFEHLTNTPIDLQISPYSNTELAFKEDTPRDVGIIEDLMFI
jgi:hypothetical protein